MTSSPDDGDLRQIKSQLDHIRAGMVDADAVRRSMHDKLGDVRDRVIRIEAQESPKRIDAQAADIGELKRDVHELKTQRGGLFWLLSFLAGSLGAFIVTWAGKMVGK